jgi:hypothetical protein
MIQTELGACEMSTKPEAEDISTELVNELESIALSSEDVSVELLSGDGS